MVALLDVTAVVIIIWCTVAAAKNGFFKTMIGFVGTFIALGAALTFGDLAAQWLYQNYIHAFFVENVTEYMSSFVMTGAGSDDFLMQIETLFDSMPQVLAEFLTRFSVSPEEVRGAIMSATSGDVLTEVSVAIATPLASAVSSGLGFIAVFIGTVIVVKIGTFVVEAVMKLPVLKTLNGAAGILLGLVQGVVVVCILAGVVTYLAPYIGSYFGQELNAQVVESTLIFKYFYEITPFKKILL